MYPARLEIPGLWNSTMKKYDDNVMSNVTSAYERATCAYSRKKTFVESRSAARSPAGVPNRRTPSAYTAGTHRTAATTERLLTATTLSPKIPVQILRPA